QEQGQFALTPLAVPLQRDAPTTLRARAIFDGGEGNWRASGQLVHSVMTGKPAGGHTFGIPCFDYLRQPPPPGPNFAALLAEQMLPWARAILAAYDFSTIGSLVDVGGGYGTLLVAILAAHPELRGVLSDLPPVIAGVGPRLASAALTERCEVLAGDFFVAVPN